MLSLPIAPDALPPQLVLKRFLHVQRFGCATVGVDPTSLERTVYNRCLALVPFLCLLALLFPMVMYAFKYVTIDLGQAVHALAPVWQSLQAVVKFCLFMWNKKEVVQLIRKVWLWSLEANDEEVKILAEENRFDRKVSVSFYIAVYVTAALALMGPFVAASFYTFRGYDYLESLEPPFKGVFFVDYHSSYWVYSGVYVWTAVALHNIVNATLAIDTLFSWFTRNISAQFRILNLRFEKAANRVNARKAQGLDTEEEFTESIIEFVKYHRRIIQLTEDFNAIYKHIVFLKFIISCLQIAGLTFQLSHEGVITDKLFTIGFLISVTIQLMLYCLGGQRVKDMSTSVASAIGEDSHWNDLSANSRRMLLLPMMRAQKPCNVSGIFFVTDLSLFLWVYRSASSFVTMMMSMYKN